MDKMREEFESWAMSDMDYMCVRVGGGYKDDYMNTAWLSWQASRAAQCVELPEVRVLDGGRIAEIGYELAIDDFERVLDGAGIRYT